MGRIKYMSHQTSSSLSTDVPKLLFKFSVLNNLGLTIFKAATDEDVCRKNTCSKYPTYRAQLTN